MSSLNPGLNPGLDPIEIASACPACSGAQREPILSVDRVPASCAQLFATREQAVQAPDCRLEIVFCPGCGHVWNASHSEDPGSLYNDDYYSSVTATPQGRGYQDDLAGNWTDC